MNRKEKAGALHSSGCNCAQSVALAFADKVNLDEQTLKALATGFGAGGGDMNGIKLLFPEIAARIIFAVIGIVHGIIIGKHLLPEYKKAFQQGE